MDDPVLPPFFPPFFPFSLPVEIADVVCCAVETVGPCADQNEGVRAAGFGPRRSLAILRIQIEPPGVDKGMRRAGKPGHAQRNECLVVLVAVDVLGIVRIGDIMRGSRRTRTDRGQTYTFHKLNVGARMSRGIRGKRSFSGSVTLPSRKKRKGREDLAGLSYSLSCSAGFIVAYAGGVEIE